MNCPICKNSIDIKKIENYRQWDLFWCLECDAQFWWPLKHPGQKFYEESYDMTGIHNKEALGWGPKEFIKNPIAKSGRLLDVGCCSGDFLNAAQSLGFDVWGIDISRRSIAVAKVLYKLRNVYGETLESFSSRANIPKFDIITFFEVLEHLDDPMAFVNHTKSILKKGGYLVFNTPDRECLPGHRDTPPQHLFKWNEENLRYVLNAHNFNIIKTIREPISHKYFLYRFFHNHSPLSLGVVSKLKNRARNRLSVDIFKSDASILQNKPFFLKLAEAGASLKAGIFKILVSPAVFIGRLLGLKWQSIYIIAKYEN